MKWHETLRAVGSSRMTPAGLVVALGVLFTPGASASTIRRGPLASDWIAEVALEENVDAELVLEVLVPRGPGAVDELLAAGSPQVDSETAHRIERALAEVPALVRTRIGETASTTQSWEPEATIALAVFGALGGPSDLDVALEVASPRPGERTRSVLTAFELALTEVLGRDRSTFGPLQRQIHGIHPSLQACMVRAVGAVSGTEALGVLVHLLGVDARLDLVLLNQVRRVAGDPNVRVDASARSIVSGYLQSPDAALRREAAAALGSLDDFDSIAELIELLEDPSMGVRENAHWALRALTGVAYRDDVRRWRAWHREETRWWSEEASSALRKLDHREKDVVAAGINELASHRLYRNEISLRLLPLLNHRDGNIVRMTCTALRAFRSPACVPELISLLDSRDARVRDAAWGALKAITGQSLPKDPAVWRDWLS